jgi:hypothetical protein
MRFEPQNAPVEPLKMWPGLKLANSDDKVNIEKFSDGNQVASN